MYNLLMDKEKQTKTSIRFFNKKPVRARWSDNTLSWWYVATDLMDALFDPSSARRYWNTFKTRHPELSDYTKQFKITASDSKHYDTDCLNQKGINLLIFLAPAQKRNSFANWINGFSDPIDEQSKRHAYELWENSILENIEVGTIKGLQQIHSYLFAGLYDFAGQIRKNNISKGGFMFANYLYFDEIFKSIEAMPSDTVEQIVDKYIELNIAHPFMEGNGRATRIWLDVLLKTKIGKCIDWQTIDKKDYLSAMEASSYDPKPITKLLKNALTDKIRDREIFLKGIDYSYYYETIE